MAENYHDVLHPPFSADPRCGFSINSAAGVPELMTGIVPSIPITRARSFIGVLSEERKFTDFEIQASGCASSESTVSGTWYMRSEVDRQSERERSDVGTPPESCEAKISDDEAGLAMSS